MFRSKIGFISSYSKLTKQLEEIAVKIEHKTDLIIKEVNPFNENEISQKGIELSEYCDVIICRSGTFDRLKEILPIPLIECRLDVIDLLEAYYEAKNYSTEIALILPRKEHQNFEHIGKMLNLNIKCYFSHEYQSQVPSIIKEIKGNNIKVVLSGVTPKYIAEQNALKGVLIESGTNTIYRSIAEAERVILAKHFEKQRTIRLQALLDNVHEGVLLLDNKNKILQSNERLREQLCGIKNADKSVLQNKIDYEFAKKDLHNFLKNDLPIFEKIFSINNKLIVANFIPVRIEKEIQGRIITIDEITRVQEVEKKLRVQLADRGLKTKYTLKDIIGNSDVILKIKQKTKSFAKRNATVLINGETGVGKELFAQNIHNYSTRCNEPFVPLNCSALPKDLLESELFGYEKGAFTGALCKGKAGLFELAHKGTLFLDEISSLPLDLQSKFLRVIQEREVMRIGGNSIIPVDVRIIASNNSDLRQAIKNGLFREDLFYRLNVLSLYIPPLRKRKKDLQLLFKHFVEQDFFQSGYMIELPSDETFAELNTYDWPGNVRELRNFSERFVALSQGNRDTDSLLKQLFSELIEKENTPVKFLFNENKTDSQIVLPEGDIFKKTIKDIEKKLLISLFENKKMTKSEIAKALGISRTTLWSKMK